MLILTDDQRFDELSRMPVVSSELVGRGASFRNGFVVNSLCCPSRTSILTGKYSHGTDVYSNDPPHGGFETFSGNGEEASTIATWLHDSGYNTGLVGKYLVGYTPDQVAYVPPGWDTWDAMTLPNASNSYYYYNYSMSIDGAPVAYGSDATDYSTDVLAGYADSFIRTAPADDPLFLYFSPPAPHAPSTSPRRYRRSCADAIMPQPPSFDEPDVSDKPAYIANRNPLTEERIASLERLYVRQCRALLGVDDAVGTLLQALSDTGRLSNTLLLFASDNGLLFGEHRWAAKKVPYEESIRIPMALRYDPVTGGTPSTDDHLVLNIDFAPTFADAAGVEAPGSEGASLLPLLDGTSQAWRNDFLVEHRDTLAKLPVPSYCAVRDERYLYVDYASAEEELYDLQTDPFQLDNLLVTSAGDPGVLAQTETMRARLLALCVPPPPDYSP